MTTIQQVTADEIRAMGPVLAATPESPYLSRLPSVQAFAARGITASLRVGPIVALAGIFSAGVDAGLYILSVRPEATAQTITDEDIQGATAAMHESEALRHSSSVAVSEVEELREWLMIAYTLSLTVGPVRILSSMFGVGVEVGISIGLRRREQGGSN